MLYRMGCKIDDVFHSIGTPTEHPRKASVGALLNFFTALGRTYFRNMRATSVQSVASDELSVLLEVRLSPKPTCLLRELSGFYNTSA